MRIQAMSSPTVQTLALLGQRRDQHRQIGLAAGAGERRRHVGDLAVGVFEAEDQHVLGQPALLPPIQLAMRSAKHFLPSSALPP